MAGVMKGTMQSVAFRNVPCLGPVLRERGSISVGQPTSIGKIDWTHVKTQLKMMTTVEDQDDDPQAVLLKPAMLKSNIESAKLEIDGKEHVLELNAEIWECVWNIGETTFPVEGKFSCVYTSPLKSGFYQIDKYKVKIKNPETPKGTCCTVQ